MFAYAEFCVFFKGFYVVVVHMMQSTDSEQTVQEGTSQNYAQRTGPFATFDWTISSKYHYYFFSQKKKSKSV